MNTKVMILVGILCSFVGLTQASEANNSSVTISAPDIKDMACSATPIARTAVYTVQNNNWRTVNLNINQIMVNASDTFTGQMTTTGGSCGNSLAGYQSCTIHINITPPVCVTNTAPLRQIIDRTLYMTVDERVAYMDAHHAIKTDLTAEIDASVTVLGSAADFAILAQNNITNANASGMAHVVGDLGAAAITSGLVDVRGTSYLGASTVRTDALIDLAAAYDTLSHLPCQTFSAAAIPNPLNPGVYCFTNNAVTVPVNLTFNGAGEFILIFENGAGANTLTVAANREMLLSNGALADDIYWLLDTRTPVINNGVRFFGNVIAKTATITGTTVASSIPATISGRLLSLSAAGTVSLQGNSVIKP